MTEKEKYNEHKNSYMKERYRKRRIDAIEKLGGKCVMCGSSENLEFDHIDPATKKFTIARISSASEARWNEELSKCQLLCTECHAEKSKHDGSGDNYDIDRTCSCGKAFYTIKQYAGHKTWCKI